MLRGIVYPNSILKMKMFLIALMSAMFFSPMQHMTAFVGESIRLVKPTDDNPKPIRVPVKKPDNSIVSGATVRLYNSSGTLLQTGTTDLEGVFTFDPVNPGSYRVTATKSGFTTDEEWTVVSTTEVTVNMVIEEL